jgi:hypothetical protein
MQIPKSGPGARAPARARARARAPARARERRCLAIRAVEQNHYGGTGLPFRRGSPTDRARARFP